ncbi:MAG: hypothetical protein IPP68_09940 [Elusimicrobia bacterium]|nr:hypothetical protein [Elusimicrobiota bacterium]
MPDNQGLWDGLSFVKSLWELPVADEYLVDFERVKFIKPLAMIHWASELERFAKERRGARLLCNNFKHLTYPAHMGFFKAFGLDFGKMAGEAGGNQNYIPVTKKDCREIEHAASQARRTDVEVLTDFSKGLAGVLCRAKTGPLFDAIVYSLVEVFRNVLEHSRSSDFWYCAQYWQHTGKVEIVILDRGRGVKESLSANPNLKISSDDDALRLAILPGVSGVAYRGRSQALKATPNSGYGLYMMHRLCRTGGSFFVGSRSSAIFLAGDRIIQYPAWFAGTGLRLILNEKSLDELRKMLDRFRGEGQACATKFGNADKLSTSTTASYLQGFGGPVNK